MVTCPGPSHQDQSVFQHEMLIGLDGFVVVLFFFKKKKGHENGKEGMGMCWESLWEGKVEHR